MVKDVELEWNAEQLSKNCFIDQQQFENLAAKKTRRRVVNQFSSFSLGDILILNIYPRLSCCCSASSSRSDYKAMTGNEKSDPALRLDVQKPSALIYIDMATLVAQFCALAP